MDRILRRAAYYNARAVAKDKRIKAKKAQHDLTESRKEHVEYRRMVKADRKASRAEIKAATILGPVAPKLAVGEKEIEMLGSMSQQRIIPPQMPEPYRIKCWNIVEGDRVVVLKGPDRHKIGKVLNVDKAGNKLTVERANMMPMAVPKVFRDADPSASPVMYREQPMDYTDVRLVIPVQDPETGKLRDTIVGKIAQSEVYHDKFTDEDTWTRYIAGTSIVIPWPEKKVIEKIDHDADTRILTVETKTFIPSLLTPPMPITVIDELRAKYSKFRTRHDQEFVEKIEKREREENERIAQLKEMARTPLQLKNRADREAKKALGPPVMSESVKEMIGRVMAQNRPDLLAKIEA